MNSKGEKNYRKWCQNDQEGPKTLRKLVSVTSVVGLNFLGGVVGL